MSTLYSSFRQKFALHRTWRRIRRLWDDYRAVAELDDRTVMMERLNAFMDAFQTAYIDYEKTATTKGLQLEKVYGDCTDIFVALLDVVDRETSNQNNQNQSQDSLEGDDSDAIKALIEKDDDMDMNVSPEAAHREKDSALVGEMVDRALGVAELILHDEKYRLAVKETPNLMERLLSLLDKLRSTETKMRALHLIASMSLYPGSRLEVGRLEGFRKMFRLFFEGNDDLKREILRTLKHFLVVSESESDGERERERERETELGEGSSFSSTSTSTESQPDVDKVLRKLDNYAASAGAVAAGQAPTGPGGALISEQSVGTLQFARMKLIDVAKELGRVFLPDIVAAVTQPSMLDAESSVNKDKESSNEDEQQFPPSSKQLREASLLIKAKIVKMDAQSQAQTHSVQSIPIQKPIPVDVTMTVSGVSGDGQAVGSDSGSWVNISYNNHVEGEGEGANNDQKQAIEPEAEAEAEGASPSAFDEEAVIMKEFMRVQGALGALTESLRGAINRTPTDNGTADSESSGRNEGEGEGGGDVNVSLDVFQMISQLIAKNPAGQDEFKRIDGYSFVMQAVDRSSYDLDTLSHIFDIILTISLDGNDDWTVGNIDAVVVLVRLCEGARELHVRKGACSALIDLISVNPINIIAIEEAGATAALFRILSKTPEFDTSFLAYDKHSWFSSTVTKSRVARNPYPQWKTIVENSNSTDDGDGMHTDEQFIHSIQTLLEYMAITLSFRDCGISLGFIHVLRLENISSNTIELCLQSLSRLCEDAIARGVGVPHEVMETIVDLVRTVSSANMENENGDGEGEAQTQDRILMKSLEILGFVVLGDPLCREIFLKKEGGVKLLVELILVESKIASGNKGNSLSMRILEQIVAIDSAVRVDMACVRELVSLYSIGIDQYVSVSVRGDQDQGTMNRWLFDGMFSVIFQLLSTKDDEKEVENDNGTQTQDKPTLSMPLLVSGKKKRRMLGRLNIRRAFLSSDIIATLVSIIDQTSADIEGEGEGEGRESKAQMRLLIISRCVTLLIVLLIDCEEAKRIVEEYVGYNSLYTMLNKCVHLFMSNANDSGSGGGDSLFKRPLFLMEFFIEIGSCNDIEKRIFEHWHSSLAHSSASNNISNFNDLEILNIIKRFFSPTLLYTAPINMNSQALRVSSHAPALKRESSSAGASSSSASGSASASASVNVNVHLDGGNHGHSRGSSGEGGGGGGGEGVEGKEKEKERTDTILFDFHSSAASLSATSVTLRSDSVGKILITILQKMNINVNVNEVDEPLKAMLRMLILVAEMHPRNAKILCEAGGIAYCTHLIMRNCDSGCDEDIVTSALCLLTSLGSYSISAKDAQLLFRLASITDNEGESRDGDGNRDGSSSMLKLNRPQVLYAIGRIVEDGGPSEFIFFDGIHCGFSFSHVERFPYAKTGYVMSCWVRIRKFTSKKSCLFALENEPGLPFLELSFIEGKHRPKNSRNLSISVSSLPNTSSSSSSSSSNDYFEFENAVFEENGGWHYLSITHRKDVFCVFIDDQVIECVTIAYPNKTFLQKPVMIRLGKECSSSRKAKVKPEVDVCVGADTVKSSKHKYKARDGESESEFEVTKGFAVNEASENVSESESGSFCGEMGNIHLFEGKWNEAMSFKIGNHGPLLHSITELRSLGIENREFVILDTASVVSCGCKCEASGSANTGMAHDDGHIDGQIQLDVPVSPTFSDHYLNSTSNVNANTNAPDHISSPINSDDLPRSVSVNDLRLTSPLRLMGSPLPDREREKDEEKEGEKEKEEKEKEKETNTLGCVESHLTTKLKSLVASDDHLNWVIAFISTTDTDQRISALRLLVALLHQFEMTKESFESIDGYHVLQHVLLSICTSLSMEDFDVLLELASEHPSASTLDQSQMNDASIVSAVTSTSTSASPSTDSLVSRGSIPRSKSLNEERVLTLKSKLAFRNPRAMKLILSLIAHCCSDIQTRIVRVICGMLLQSKESMNQWRRQPTLGISALLQLAESTEAKTESRRMLLEVIRRLLSFDPSISEVQKILDLCIYKASLCYDLLRIILECLMNLPRAGLALAIRIMGCYGGGHQGFLALLSLLEDREEGEGEGEREGEDEMIKLYAVKIIGCLLSASDKNIQIFKKIIGFDTIAMILSRCKRVSIEMCSVLVNLASNQYHVALASRPSHSRNGSSQSQGLPMDGSSDGIEYDVGVYGNGNGNGNNGDLFNGNGNGNGNGKNEKYEDNTVLCTTDTQGSGSVPNIKHPYAIKVAMELLELCEVGTRTSGQLRILQMIDGLLDIGYNIDRLWSENWIEWAWVFIRRLREEFKALADPACPVLEIQLRAMIRKIIVYGLKQKKDVLGERIGSMLDAEEFQLMTICDLADGFESNSRMDENEAPFVLKNFASLLNRVDELPGFTADTSIALVNAINALSVSNSVKIRKLMSEMFSIRENLLLSLLRGPTAPQSLDNIWTPLAFESIASSSKFKESHGVLRLFRLMLRAGREVEVEGEGEGETVDNDSVYIGRISSLQLVLCEALINVTIANEDNRRVLSRTIADSDVISFLLNTNTNTDQDILPQSQPDQSQSLSSSGTGTGSGIGVPLPLSARSNSTPRQRRDSRASINVTPSGSVSTSFRLPPSALFSDAFRAPDKDGDGDSKDRDRDRDGVDDYDGGYERLDDDDDDEGADNNPYMDDSFVEDNAADFLDWLYDVDNVDRLASLNQKIESFFNGIDQDFSKKQEKIRARQLKRAKNRFAAYETKKGNRIKAVADVQEKCRGIKAKTIGIVTSNIEAQTTLETSQKELGQSAWDVIQSRVEQEERVFQKGKCRLGCDEDFGNSASALLHIYESHDFDTDFD